MRVAVCRSALWVAELCLEVVSYGLLHLGTHVELIVDCVAKLQKNIEVENRLSPNVLRPVGPVRYEFDRHADVVFNEFDIVFQFLRNSAFNLLLPAG